eukprot:CAMPEP_0184995774 /NCGR_PEP_ID=MMETSP1098-20130426/53964_1 /TAXON_ID=89044 /ORGANISM="Spumella elongata, Strain CCAP 955/1" /LENGTH=36 /DNA_ID= /DNA_START= /DNA_END= /DNA_ORIENTATION=
MTHICLRLKRACVAREPLIFSSNAMRSGFCSACDAM